MTAEIILERKTLFYRVHLCLRLLSLQLCRTEIQLIDHISAFILKVLVDLDGGCTRRGWWSERGRCGFPVQNHNIVNPWRSTWDTIRNNRKITLHLTLDCEMVQTSQLCITITLKLFKKKIKKKEVLDNSWWPLLICGGSPKPILL